MDAEEDRQKGGAQVRSFVVRCQEPGCKQILHIGNNARFCPAHHGQCKEEGCTNVKLFKDGYCEKHHKKFQVELKWPETARQAKAREEAYEWVQRLKRKADLRKRHIDALLAKQGGQCAKSFVTCEIVGDGYARHVCRWGNKPLPLGAADVDHIVPLADGGTDDEDNLQVLCKCCHGLKTEAETYARKYKRIREEARAKEEANQKRRLEC
jgi:5-methylcytosine-specific restriction endonuclease McrA